MRVLLQEASQSKISTELRNNQGLLAQDLTLDHEILTLLGVDTSTTMGRWSKGNRHIERLLEKVGAEKQSRRNFDL